jgi:hypothetical protein
MNPTLRAAPVHENVYVEGSEAVITFVNMHVSLPPFAPTWFWLNPDGGVTAAEVARERTTWRRSPSVRVGNPVLKTVEVVAVPLTTSVPDAPKVGDAISGHREVIEEAFPGC